MIKLLTKNGYKLIRITGSHHILYKEGEKELVVPVHGKKDLRKGLEIALLKDAGLR